MANVRVSSYHNAGRLTRMSASTPADVAEALDLATDHVDLYLNEEPASMTAALRENDLVSFTRKSTKSGR